ncbi:hypothetical protein QQF64_026080 [Cirrhinus molitorella]|uniref:Uncharacterized protein n=1 Tax=Cirrhinus molitorella TaxID=172907 RepID=A0ABR3NQU2_9TELE
MARRCQRRWKERKERRGNSLKRSRTHKMLGRDDSKRPPAPVYSGGPRVPGILIVIIVEFAVFAAPTVILLQIICERRAERKDSQHREKVVVNIILE